MSTTSSAEPAGGNSHKKHSSANRLNSPRWVTFATLAIAVIAAAVAIAAWFRPARQSAAPTFSGQQNSQAKANVCSAYTSVRDGVVINTHLVSPGPNDPTGQLAVAANARLALLGGGAYLQDLLVTQPASPTELAKAAESMANTMQRLGTAYLADATNTMLDPLRHDLDAEIDRINQLCA